MVGMFSLLARPALQAAALSIGVAFLAPSPQASAAVFDFGKLASGNSVATGGTAPFNFGVGEGNWDTKINNTGNFYVVDGIGVSADGFGNTLSRAYLDGPSGGKPAGLGVCSLTSCAGSSDDNLGRAGDTTGGALESIVLTFSQQVKITDLTFRDRDHNLFTGRLSIEGTETDVTNGVLTGLSLIDTMFTFARISGGTLLTRDFYLNGVTAFLSPPGGGGEVPLPPAALLFGSVLAGGGLLARWKKKRAATA